MWLIYGHRGIDQCPPMYTARGGGGGGGLSASGLEGN